jgi:hypothetical protein
MIKYCSLIITLVCALSLSAQDWVDMQKKTIRFYRYQRAGLKGLHCHNPYYEGITSNWPHQNDTYSGNDLSGGWYDAGDFVKFGLPFSSTVYILLKGYDVFPNAYSDVDSWDKFNVADGIPDILNEVKFATDYIIKAVINNTTVVYDIGDGDADHTCSLNGCGGPTNSSSVGNRPARLADGADVPGLYAASLALMSQLYRKYDSDYADLCLKKAKEAFQAGWSKRSKGVSSQFGEFYNSSKTPSGFIWHDKMMAGALELYRVTNEQQYLDNLKILRENTSVMHNNIGYTNVAPLVSFELWRQFQEQPGELISNVAFLLSKVIESPGKMNGVYFNQQWGMVGGAACAALTAALAYIVDPKETYKTFAEKQLKWICGKDNASTQSWIVGFNGGPNAVHHRNAIWKGMLPEGALISGPNADGTWSSSAADYKHTEVALDYNAGIPGAIAFIRDLNDESTVKVTTALEDNATSVDFAANQSVQYTAQLSKSVSWKLVITGDKSGAKKVFSGTGTNVSVKWNGDADEASFVTYDQVTAQIQVENLSIYDIKKSTAYLEIAGIKFSPFKSSDVLVDVFDDANFVNKQGGVWKVFNDQSFGGNSTTYPVTLPASNTSEGESGLGLNVIMYAKTKLEHPFAGIKMTFNNDSSVVSLGNSKSIVFDYKCTKAGGTFFVELEQTDISDSAYYGYKVNIPNTAWNRVRVPLSPSALSVRSWKTTSVPFSTNNVTAMRIVNYETDNVNITLDSVHIEGLQIIKPISVRKFKKVYKNGIAGRFNGLTIPAHLIGKNGRIEILDVQGTLMQLPEGQQITDNESINISLNHLSSGMYLVRIKSESRQIISVPVMVTY